VRAGDLFYMLLTRPTETGVVYVSVTAFALGEELLIDS
jgi:hypothetical protein